jgi:molybdate-binding protein/DNA-binding PadR family transcriptional regulator
MLLLNAILALLALSPRHGYQLRLDLEAEFGPEFVLDTGQLYRLLARLEKEGWATASAEPGERGPRRKVYRITPAGRAALRRWARSPAARRERGRDPFVVQQIAAADAPLRVVGSDDLLLSLLQRQFAAAPRGPQVSARTIGSLGGLLALRARRADVAGIHLFDVDSGTWNVPFVRHLLPEEPIVLVHLARREQGLFVAPGNPLRVRGVADLARKGVRYCNRQRDAGTRLFVLQALRRAGVDPAGIDGYGHEVSTHDAVAAAVARGRADVGPGIRAVAGKWGLGFVPLGEESFDLAIPAATFDAPRLRPFLEAIHEPAFLRAAAALAGYDTARTSRVVARIN